MAKRLSTRLMHSVMELPLQDRVELLGALRISVRESVARDARLVHLADKMRDVSGVDVREARCRSKVCVWPRNVFCFVAGREGFSQSTIGGLIGRDHSSVCIASKRMREVFAMPALYREEIELYNRYVEAL